MINNIILQNKIEQTILINSKLYSLRKLGALKKEDIKQFTKNIVLLSGIVMNIVKEVIMKLIYLYIIYFIIKLICGKYNSNIFINSFIFLSIFGSIINSKILKTSKSKYHSVILLNMNCKDYTIFSILSNLIFSFIFQFISFLLLQNILKISLPLNLLLCIFLVLIKIVGEAFNMFYYQKKKNLFLNNTILYFILLTFLLALIIITSKLHIYISTNILSITNIVLLILSIISFFYILKINDYKTIYKRVININSYSLNDGSSISKEEIYSINNEYNDKVNRNKYNNPYKYFNSIFIKRHRSILLKPILREAIFLLIIGVIAVIGTLVSKQINDLVGYIIMKYFMWIFLIIYMLNKTSRMTEAMFINCDRSLLTYDFYKEKNTIISIFKERILSLTIINLLPVTILSIFIPLLLHITVGMNIYNMILIFITLITTSILFTIHFLSLYYLMEPYDKDSKIIDLKYQIINSILTIILFVLIRTKISLNILTITTVSISILYSILSIILVNNKAQNTFKLK